MNAKRCGLLALCGVAWIQILGLWLQSRVQEFRKYKRSGAGLWGLRRRTGAGAFAGDAVRANPSRRVGGPAWLSTIRSRGSNNFGSDDFGFRGTFSGTWWPADRGGPHRPLGPIARRAPSPVPTSPRRSSRLAVARPDSRSFPYASFPWFAGDPSFAGRRLMPDRPTASS